MTTPKYRLTDTIKVAEDGTVVRRIQAVRDIAYHHVTTGDLGGWVNNDYNLSHDGDCWIADDAIVSGDAVVQGDALVQGTAWVSDRAVIMDSARVAGAARVDGDATVAGIAVVTAGAHVHDGLVGMFDVIAPPRDIETITNMSATMDKVNDPQPTLVVPFATGGPRHEPSSPTPVRWIGTRGRTPIRRH